MEMACVALAVRTHDATGRYGLLCLCIESKSAALYLADQIRKSHYMDTSCARSQAREEVLTQHGAAASARRAQQRKRIRGKEARDE